MPGRAMFKRAAIAVPLLAAAIALSPARAPTTAGAANSMPGWKEPRRRSKKRSPRSGPTPLDYPEPIVDPDDVAEFRSRRGNGRVRSYPE